MLLFLVLNIGALLYAVYISVWHWNLRTGPVTFLGLENYQNVLSDPTFQRAIQNSLYYAVVWVPLTMAIGLFLAVIVNQKHPRPDVLPGGVLLPGDRQLGRDHDAVDLPRRAGRPVQRHPGRAGARPALRVLRLPAQPELDRTTRTRRSTR